MPVTTHAFVAMPFGMKPAPRNPADRNPTCVAKLREDVPLRRPSIDGCRQMTTSLTARRSMGQAVA
jgi:hypothetical protein